jgi:hypothetical protein
MRLIAPIGYPDAPSTTSLRQWSVVEIIDDQGEPVHLAVGLLNDSPTRLRVTSPIRLLEGGRLQSRSGSVYVLAGPPASVDQLQEQRSRREALLGGRIATDVTPGYLPGL